MVKKVLTGSLSIKGLRYSDVLWGFIRIHENKRGCIRANTIIKLRCLDTKKHIRRIVRGIPDGPDSDIQLDEYDRELLCIKGRSTAYFEISSCTIIGQALWVLLHPNASLRIPAWLALIFGIVSILVSIVGAVVPKS